MQYKDRCQSIFSSLSRHFLLRLYFWGVPVGQERNFARVDRPKQYPFCHLAALSVAPLSLPSLLYLGFPLLLEFDPVAPPSATRADLSSGVCSSAGQDSARVADGSC
ncbi:hypothetical protein KM043_012358 [Ampulex compressa]|nr:hypothetical protein KM043_012358 [Ampulex compressa]